MQKLLPVLIACFSSWLLSAQAPYEITDGLLENAGFDFAFNYDKNTKGNISGDILNEVFGWTKDMNATFTVAGTFAYGSKATFNASSAIPDMGYNNSAGGALALSTGWDVTLKYSQTVTLPKGNYTLIAAYYNAGTTNIGTSVFGWVPKQGAATAISTVKAFPVRQWIPDTIRFTLLTKTDGKIQIGYTSGGGASAGNAKILVDYVKVFFEGEADKTQLAASLSTAHNIDQEATVKFKLLEKAITDAEAVIADTNASMAEVLDANKILIQNIDLCVQGNEQIATSEELYLPTGVDAADLLVAINALKSVFNSLDVSFADVSASIESLAVATYQYQLKNASDEQALDMTHLITNPSFESGMDGWTNNGMAIQGNNVFPNKHGSSYAERWVNRGLQLPNTSIQQNLSAIPNGKYTLVVAAGHIQQSASGSAVNLGQPQTGAWIFANEEILAVDTIKNRSIDCIVFDGQLSIGLKAENPTGNWLTCDNFRLLYKGFNIDVIADVVREKISEAEALLSQKMQTIVKEELENTIRQAEDVTQAEPLVLSDLHTVQKKLSAAVQHADISIAAYDALQNAIDEAEIVYEADKTGSDDFQAALTVAEQLVDNDAATLEEIYEGTAAVYTAVFAFRLANGTGTVPRVTTNTNYARGATAFLGRATIAGSNILEHGFCWSTHPEPTVLDNKSTKSFVKNGTIYHIDNLQPATVYYMRAYALTKTYAVGYGDVIKVVTIPKGSVTFTLNSSVTNSGEHYPRIREAVETAVDYFNNYTSIQGHRLSVNHHAGTPTAEASYGGYMQFGASSNYQRTGTALHEMGHTVGVGTHSMWNNSPLRESVSRGKWLGEQTTKLLQFLDNSPTAFLTGDNTHMWPYGINGAHEDTGEEWLYIFNALIHQALGEDGLPPTAGKGITPSYTFEYEDGVKYYIKNEHSTRGLETSFLTENSAGNLVYSVMSGEEALNNDSAAWYFTYNPKTRHYNVKNAATNKFFTYKSASAVNGISLIAKDQPAATENFQLMRSWVETPMGSGNNQMKMKGYWIMRPQDNLNPPCLIAGANGATASAALSITNTASTQRWLLMTEDDLQLFDLAFPSALHDVKSEKLFAISNVEGGIMIVAAEGAVQEHLEIYSIAGQLLKIVDVSVEKVFVPLGRGAYIVGGQKVMVR